MFPDRGKAHPLRGSVETRRAVDRIAEGRPQAVPQDTPGSHPRLDRCETPNAGRPRAGPPFNRQRRLPAAVRYAWISLLRTA